MIPRLIPCLLYRNAGFVKTVKFSEPKYLGDPLNILKIFNEKEVDEILILDIMATRDGRAPKFNELTEMARECFMPLGYGGGIRTLSDIERILGSGFEKVSLNTAAFDSSNLIEEAAKHFGSQSIVMSLDVKRNFFGKPEVFTRCGQKNTGRSPEEVAKEMEGRGAGEILVNAIHRDGMMKGYDLLSSSERVAASVSIPVISCGGVGSLEDLVAGIRKGASAAAAGSFFVYKGPHRAVLINAPTYQEVKRAFHTPISN